MDMEENMNIEEIEIERKPRVVFMGTPEFSVPVLQGLIDNFDVKAVVTQPDKKVGREGKIAYSPIKKVALENDIVVLQPTNLKEQYQEILDLEPDVIVTCAYGKILPKEILDYPKYGCINVHASLLPELRGGAPIQRAIMNGLDKTGITIMYMAPGMDDGDIITQEETNIVREDTGSSLHDRLSVMGKDLLLKTLPKIFEGENGRMQQNPDRVTYAPIITKEDEHIDFSKTALEIHNQIRALNSFPGAYCELKGKRLKVYDSFIKDEYHSEKLNGEIISVTKEGIEVKVSNGVIVFTVLQKEGKPRMHISSFINGLNEDIKGSVLC